jgi:hypothetical protein
MNWREEFEKHSMNGEIAVTGPFGTKEYVKWLESRLTAEKKRADDYKEALQRVNDGE